MVRARTISVVIGLVLCSAPVAAQPLGSFRWQIVPYCNVLTLSLAQQGGVYTLDGTDDRCGAPPPAAALGIAFVNQIGTISLGVTMVQPGGTPVHLEAAIDVQTLNGTWRDSSGASGNFVFTPGAGIGGPPRLVPSNGIGPASVTSIQLAPNAVGSAAIAPGAVGPSAIAAGAVGSFALAAGAVGPSAIAPGAVGPSAITIGAVTSAHIADGDVTAADLAPGAVGPSAIAIGAVTSAHIADGNVTAADLAPGAVGAAAVAANAIFGGHVVDGSLTASDLLDEPRAASAEGVDFFTLPSIEQVIREVTVVAPTAGKVIVTASGNLFFFNPGSLDFAYCSISRTTNVERPYAAYVYADPSQSARLAAYGRYTRLQRGRGHGDVSIDLRGQRRATL